MIIIETMLLILAGTVICVALIVSSFVSIHRKLDILLTIDQGELTDADREMLRATVAKMRASSAALQNASASSGAAQAPPPSSDAKKR
jgi:hypothetical protein